MSCKNIQQLIEDSQLRTLSKNELTELQTHIGRCDVCAAEFEQNSLLTNIILESSAVDETYIIPQEIMRSKVENQLRSNKSKLSLRKFFSNPIMVPIFSIALILFGFLNFANRPNNNPVTYEVSLDGMDIAIAEDDNILCDIFNLNGLPEASIDIIGCNTTCELVIFDLKTEQEAERVIEILHTIDKNLTNTNIIKVRQYHI